jgi:hypothetical protein
MDAGLKHLLKCSEVAASHGQSQLTPEDAWLLLEKLRCVAFLGGGSFGTVFETAAGLAVKLIPRRKSLGIRQVGAQHEFHMQKAFARRGLALQPCAFQRFRCSEAGEEDASAEIGALSMPKIAWTLDRCLQAGGLRPSSATSIGTRLVHLLTAACAAGLVHNDAKCNNVSVSMDAMDMHFIDFGRAFDVRDLSLLGAGGDSATEAIRLGTALDAWRLQASLSRLLDRAPKVEWPAPQKAAVLEPLQALALRLLKECCLVPKTSQPSTAWWRDDRKFQELKTTLSKSLSALGETKRKQMVL